MRKLVLLLAIVIAVPVFGHAQFDAKKFKKGAVAFERAIDGIADSVLPDYGRRRPTESMYLEGYGAVFVVEVALERASNPFFSPGSPEEVNRNMSRRQKEITTKISDLLKNRFSELQALGNSDAVSVVVNVFNSNPAYVKNLPAQIVFTARKRDAGVEVTQREYEFPVQR